MINFRKKIEAILLGKVENLKWFYFELDFDNILEYPYVNKEKITDFFNRITENSYGNFVYEKVETDKEIFRIILTVINKNPDVIVSIMKRIFDLNEIKNNSSSNVGRMGEMNRKNRDERNDIYIEKIIKRHRANKDNVVILAEGDSWFQFPKYYPKRSKANWFDAVKDIIDWLIEEERYAIYSLAAGGDWLSNMFNSDEYIEELPKVSPDVLLLSGGGNDMVGGFRLATMLINPILEESQIYCEDRATAKDERFCDLLEKRANDENIKYEVYKKGLKFLSLEFFYFLNTIYIQYYIFIYNILQSHKYKKMLIITHGYDYAIPFEGYRGEQFRLRPIQRLYNHVLETGVWLFQPLSMKGIVDKEDQKAVLYTMIYEFNEMMCSLANNKNFKNLFHIDARGVAQDEDWFDELHLKSASYEKIAKVFKKCIDENLRLENEVTKKIYRVKDELND